MIGSFQRARRKTMSTDGCQKIAEMHVALNTGLNSCIFLDDVSAILHITKADSSFQLYIRAVFDWLEDDIKS